jgi:hypothetical protein
MTGAADIFCDNQSVIYNASVPESTLSKKHNAIAYHRVRESVAMGMTCITKVDTKYNLADGFTKPLPAPRHRFIFTRILDGLGHPPDDDVGCLCGRRKCKCNSSEAEALE